MGGIKCGGRFASFFCSVIWLQASNRSVSVIFCRSFSLSLFAEFRISSRNIETKFVPGSSVL